MELCVQGNMIMEALVKVKIQIGIICCKITTGCHVGIPRVSWDVPILLADCRHHALNIAPFPSQFLPVHPLFKQYIRAA
jgi:hypothetical protein